MAHTQEPQGTTSPAATEMSTHEWQSQMDAGYGGTAQPTGGDSTSTSQAEPPPTGNPLIRWLKNLGRSAPDAANQMLRTAGGLSVSLQANRPMARALSATPVVGPAIEAATRSIATDVNMDLDQAKELEVVSEAQIAAVYGPKPKDTVGALIHGLGQATTGMAFAGPVGLPAAAAISLGTAFDPSDPTIADALLEHEKLIEELPIAGRAITNMARLLRVDPTDSPEGARFKKIIEGEGVGRLTVAILKPALSRLAARATVARRATAADMTRIEKSLDFADAMERAEAEIARAQPTDVVTMRAGAEAGTVEVVPVQTLREPVAPGGRPNGSTQRFHDAVNEEFGFAPGEDPIVTRGSKLPDAPASPAEFPGLASATPEELATARNVPDVSTFKPAELRAERAKASARLASHDVSAVGAAQSKVAVEADRAYIQAIDSELSTRSVGVRLKTSNRGPDVVEVELLENLTGKPEAAQEALARLTRIADEHNVTLTLQATPLKEGLDPAKLRDIYRKGGFEQSKVGEANMVRRPGDVSPEFRELDEGIKTVYSDPAAAASDVATTNAAALEVSRAGSVFTPDEVVLHLRTVEAIKSNGDLSVLETNPHFNLQSMGNSADVDAQIGALTTQYSDLFSAAQGRPGVPNEVLHNVAARWASEVHLDNFLPALAKADAAGRVDLSLKAALYNAANKQAAQEVAEISMLMAAKPGDEALDFLMRRRLETFLRVGEATANFNTELGRGLQALSARGAASAGAIRFGSGVVPRESITAPAVAKTPVFRPLNPQNIPPEKLAALARLFARSGGDVRVATHVMEAMNKAVLDNTAAWEAKSLAGRVESRLVATFINSVISGIKTMQTIAFSGATLNAFRATAKVVAGAGTLNRGLAEEGAMQWAGLAYYARANMRGAWAAFKENRSVIQGTPPFSVDPSKTMKGIQVPGRVAGTLDEFTRQAAYRADEFAAGFRQARNEDLPFTEAARRAAVDVNTSIDAQTGIGLNAAALKRAGIPTLSDHPGNTTFMGKLTNVLAEFPLTKFIVPFIRPSVNTFRFAHANTPVLNRFSRDAQAIFQAGGEEATVLHAQSAMVGSMIAYSTSLVMDSQITGKGPSDPQLRAQWLNNHEPYSMRLADGKWHSYRRTEPFATFFGMVADTYEVFGEIPEEDRDELLEKVEGAMNAVFVASTRNVTSKSWTESLLNAMKALDDGNENGGAVYMRGVLTGLIPYSNAIRQFNPDPVWHEVRSVVDNVRTLFPGWSEGLPARADWSGEINAKQGSMWNRNFSIFPEKDAKPSVEDVLVDNYIRLSPPNPRPFKGIDMWDEKWALPDGRKPYEVFMEKLKATGVRGKVEKLVESEAFTNAPPGSVSFPNSLRADLVQQIVGAAQEAALHQMLAEFQGNGFAQAYNQARYVIPSVAKYQGQEAANARKELYGIPTETRR